MFFFLMLAVITWMTVGWYVIGGLMPLYPFPLSVALLLMVITGKFLSVNVALRNVLAILTLLTGWVLLSTVFANESLRGSGAVMNYLAGTAILLVSYHSIEDFSQIKKALGIYSLIVAAGLCLGLLQVTTGRFYLSEAAYAGGPAGFEGMNYAFGKNFLPLVAAGASLMVVSSMNIGELGKPKWWFLIIGFAGVALSGSRSTQLGSVAIFLTAFLVSRRWNLLWLSGVVMVGFTVLVLASEKWARIFEDSFASASGGRFSFWGAAWNMIKENPLFGIGAGNFKLLMPQYLTHEGALSLHNTEVLSTGIAAHNVFIGLAAESGVLAALLYITFYFYIMWLSYRVSRRPYSSIESRILAHAGFFYLVGYFIDMNFHNYGDENTIWFFAGLILAMEKMGAEKRVGFVKAKFARPMRKSSPPLSGSLST